MARPKNPNNTLHKICPTCKSEFTCEKRKEKMYCSRVCACNSPEVKEKNKLGVAKTFDAKYGGHAMKTDAVKENYKAAMMATHGVEWAGGMSDHVEKVKKTLTARYGDENYNNTAQMKATMIEKYGVDNYRKSKEYEEKYKKTCAIKYGVAHASKSSEFKDAHKITMFKKFVSSERFKHFVPLFNIEDYFGVKAVSSTMTYSFKCNRCNREEVHSLNNGATIKCSKCDKTMSDFQSSIFEFIKTLVPDDPVIPNDRTTLFPREIDIYLPNQKIGIECNGLYWHTEVSGGKNRNYHLNKTNGATFKGIRLIHIFENEWNHSQEVVKSVLRNILTKNNIKIYARKCEIRDISSQEKKEFLARNHIQGNDHATIKLGMYFNKELVSVMTFVKSRFDTAVEWEMSRFCSKLGHTVIGGSSRLFSHFVKKHNPNSIVTYGDRRYFSGEVYLKLGFNFVATTPPGYYYTVDGYSTLSGRQGWQKHKLANKLLSFDPALSEWENMKMNGFDRIWDCGHSKWVWKSVDTDKKLITTTP